VKVRSNLSLHEACEGLGSSELTCVGVVRECGDPSCDGGFDADDGPDRLYPGQISVPVGCNCRTCRGCTFVSFRIVLIGLDCQCRRCACSIRDPGRNLGITKSNRTEGSCCGKKRDVQSERETDGELSVEPVIESKEMGDFGVGLLALDYIHTKSDEKSTASGG
jgi:hypothetical protein